MARGRARLEANAASQRKGKSFTAKLAAETVTPASAKSAMSRNGRD
jgi:hypothetical protein